MFCESSKRNLNAILIGNEFGCQFAILVDPDLLRNDVFSVTKKIIGRTGSKRLLEVFPTGLAFVPSLEVILPEINAIVEAIFDALKDFKTT